MTLSELNKMDAFFETDGYKPREPKKTENRTERMRFDIGGGW